ncbi:alpha-E domain-containing protein [Spiribacter halobius]|uniref:DUF403 domain-containing protein n=1 Tax=Sediminicurvatus halobius TaxID=2182432 RepID=A0A2U2MVX1_9GAMM|nr:alpha-E domain-containing protein [Spiribacter halobius]PWG61003.1 hypothetical protein DEM34_18685 [Spiribacter halobius]UEX78732.1 alpha-E domain-containing protein [Spiribacter halobius]
MLSRVAENLYWMTRYLERAENTARLINTTSQMVLDGPRNVPVSWRSLVDILGSRPRFDAEGLADDERSVMRFLVDEPAHGGSIQASVRAARENARTVRELLPAEVWEGINELYFLVRDNAVGQGGRRRRFDFLRRVIGHNQQITGVIEGTLSRGAPYQFVTIAQHLERADMTSRILDVRASQLVDEDEDALDAWQDAGWMTVLRSLGAYIMYRQSMNIRIRGSSVVSFLLRDEQFPRSVRYCLQRTARALRALPRSDPPLAELARLEQALEVVAPGALALGEVHDYIDELQSGLGQLHRAVTQTYFPEPP